MNDEKKEMVSEELVKQIQMLIDEKKKRGYRRQHNEDKVSGYALKVIYEADGEVNPSDICAAMNVTMPRVTNILNELEEHGFIERTVSKQDRRKTDVHLTAEGTRHVEEHQKMKYEKTRRLLEKVGPDDAQALLRILQAIE